VINYFKFLLWRVCNGVLGVFLMICGFNANEIVKLRIVEEKDGGQHYYRK
jgi:hypothetical protein